MASTTYETADGGTDDFEPWALDEEEAEFPPEDLDDWEGPALPEYSEYDAESFAEMLWDDMRGAI